MTEPAAVQPNPNKKLLLAVIGLSVVLIAVLGIFLLPRLFGDSKADAVYKTCSEPDSGLTVDGNTIEFDYPGEFDREYKRIKACLVTETGMPATILDRINTTGVDEGTGSGSWSGWDATWEYSVEDGLSMNLTST